MSNVAYADFGAVKAPVERKVAELEDGYAKLSNMLLEAYAGADLTKRQFKVLLAILRKTYGWNKPMDRISDSQISEIAKLPVKRCNEAKLELVRMGLIKQQGGMFGPNKNIDEWCIPQNEGISLKTGDKTSLNLRESYPSKQGDTKDTIQKTIKTITQTHEVGLLDVVSEKPLTPRQLGTNPRATGTNPRSKLPAFDRERLKETWNCKAERFGLPKIRSVTTTVENGIKRLWVSYLKQCKELKREPKDIDSLLNGYLEHGYQPTPWAMGQNPEGKRYGIETALRQEKIDQILGADS
ncbi:replication protein [Cronobacter sakazakii]|uniref:replication protein n=1 Tax=Cronobacter sakazakii TaxID=28141 RepID=UPI000A112E56|nr:replication protein [Cronobacter sakazakii]HAV6907427.1 DNA replication protein [Cronobacter sakazakii]